MQYNIRAFKEYDSRSVYVVCFATNHLKTKELINGKIGISFLLEVTKLNSLK